MNIGDRLVWHLPQMNKALMYIAEDVKENEVLISFGKYPFGKFINITNMLNRRILCTP